MGAVGSVSQRDAEPLRLQSGNLVAGSRLVRAEEKAVGATVTLKGTVVDTHCYITHGLNDAKHTAPADLVTSVPIYGVAGEQKIYLGRVFAEGEESHFTISAPADVKQLVLDPYHTVMTSPQ